MERAAFLMVMAAVGCEPVSGNDPGGPALEIAGDADAIDCAGVIGVTVDLANFELREPTGQFEDGVGHYHVYLDDDTGANYITMDYIPSVTVELPAAIAPGAHRLRFQLMNGDHTPFTPTVDATWDFQVSTNPCIDAWLESDTISQQAGGSVIHAFVEVGQFQLAPPGGVPNPLRGHYHVYLDNASGPDYLYAGADSEIDVQLDDTADLGDHTLAFVLVGDDHVPITPPTRNVQDFTIVP